MISERYRPYSKYLSEKYGGRVYKLPVNLPVTCPNRDGTLGNGGCIFCGDKGAAFENLPSAMSVQNQLKTNMNYIGKKYKADKFIAYFQNFTNTYLPFEDFKKYINAAVMPNIVEISVSTRPDCVRTEHLNFLREISLKHGVNISIEMGLQTVNYHTLEKVNRGHGLAEFIDARLAIMPYGFDVCAHLILNLPWDNRTDVIECAKILSALKVHQVKLHCLYIVKDTPMAKMYENGEFHMGTYHDYVDIVTEFLEFLHPDIAIQRLIGRAKEEFTVFANYGASWWKIKDAIDENLEKLNTKQGAKCSYLGGSAAAKFF